MAKITKTIPTETLTYVNVNNEDKHKFVDSSKVKNISVFGKDTWTYTTDSTVAVGGGSGGGFSPGL